MVRTSSEQATASVLSPHGSAVVVGDHDFQQASVHAVQTYLVDVHAPQGLGSLFRGDDVVAAHHGKIPHATQEAVGDARCAAGAAAYLFRTVRE